MKETLLINLEEFEEAERYWYNKFSGELGDAGFYRDYHSNHSYEKGIYRLEFDEPVKEQLSRVGKNNDLSIYIILLTALKILLARHSGQSDIIVSSPIYTQSNREYNRWVAFRDFVNPGMTFKDLLINIKQTVVEGYKNEHYPLEKIIEYFELDPSLLFRTILIYEQVHEKKYIETPIDNLTNEIIFSAAVDRQHMSLEIIYNAKSFKKETVQGLSTCYLGILTRALNETGIRISEIELMTPGEKNNLLIEFNKTGREYPAGKNLHELFEEQVLKHPANIALRSSIDTKNIYDESSLGVVDIQLDYEELNTRANQLANELRREGVKPDSIVGIIVQHPLEMVVSIWGILKAGGAYLPIEAAYPGKIKESILKDSNTRVVITEQSFAENLLPVETAIRVILVDDHSLTEVGVVPPPAPNDIPSRLAYAIYTSGTTGKPKGTLIEHRGVVNYATWRIRAYGFSQEDVTLQMLSYCFDGFGSNFYSSLLSGGTLVIVPDSRKMDYRYIIDTIKNNRVTNTSLVPGMYEALLETGSEQDLKTIRFVVLAGDKSKPDLIRLSKNKAPQALLINEYGPTEATIAAASNPKLDETNLTHIGKPAANTRLYILDDSLGPLPVNFGGELYIAGTGLARGYLNKPELTGEKFIMPPATRLSLKKSPKDPAALLFIHHSTTHHSPLTIYKTGDLARWLVDGTVEFLGRKDHQVKIRGFRIELGEIESQMLKHEDILEVAVTARQDEADNKYLCAYYVEKPGEPSRKLDGVKLREYLSQTLPDHMIPSYFVPLDFIPLTSAGKLNRKALPEPGDSVDDFEYAAPGNPLEEKLEEIWSKILGIEKNKIGVTRDFNNLGGDSMKAIKLVSTAARENIHFDIKDLYEYRTIKEISKNIKHHKKKATQSEVSGEVPLLPNQRWIFSYNHPHPGFWNVYFSFYIAGRVDIEIMEKSIDKLIRHHDALRINFIRENGEWKQIIRKYEEVDFHLRVVTLDDTDIKRQQQEKADYLYRMHCELDFGKDLYTRAVLFDLGTAGQQIFISIHHFICDLVSMHIFVEDLAETYAKYLQNRGTEVEIELNAKTTSYSEWSNRINSEFNRGNIDIGYWKNLEPDRIDYLVPREIPRTPYSEIILAESSLDEKDTEALKSAASKKYNASIEEILLSALIITLHHMPGLNNILVDIESHGRAELFEDVDLSRTIGWFSDSYPVLLEYKGDIKASIDNTKKILRGIPHKGIYYNIAKYILNEDLPPLNSQVAFNYMGESGIQTAVDDRLQSLFTPGPQDKPITGIKEIPILNVHPANYFPSVLLLVARIVDSRIQTRFFLNRKCLQPGVIESLPETYKKNLEKIINL